MVAAATGAVGSVVGQVARVRGARAVGIAGGPQKCRCAVEELGFDACLDHHDPQLPERLASVCARGIDVYFENVGGPIFDAVLPLLNVGARIPLCGLIHHYNDPGEAAMGPDRLHHVLQVIHHRRITVRGFIILDHYATHHDAFVADMQRWLASGQVKAPEDVTLGLENAATAFIGLLEGKNLGKAVVKVADA